MEVVSSHERHPFVEGRIGQVHQLCQDLKQGEGQSINKSYREPEFMDAFSGRVAEPVAGQLLSHEGVQVLGKRRVGDSESRDMEGEKSERKEEEEEKSERKEEEEEEEEEEEGGLDIPSFDLLGNAQVGWDRLNVCVMEMMQ